MSVYSEEAAGRSASEDAAAGGVSACLIVRNEQRHLTDCLRSLGPWVDEVCIVDTGSTDRTLAAAEAAGARIARTTWRDDFSVARNASLELATRRWILVIDADERLSEGSGPALRRAITPAPGMDAPLAWLVHVDSRTPRGAPRSHMAPRLFRNLPDLRYRRRVHESIMEALIARGVERLPPSAVRIDHVGYLDAGEVHAKRRRNLRLLRLARCDDSRDPFVLYKLARSLQAPAEQAERIAVLERARAIDRGLSAETRATYPFLPLVHDALAASLAARGRLGAAIEVARGARRLHPAAPELDVRLVELLRRAGRIEEAVQLVDDPPAARSGPAGTLVPVRDLRCVRAAFALESARLLRMRGATGLARHALDESLALGRTDVEARRLEVDLALDHDLHGPEARRLFAAFCEEFGARRPAWLVGARVARANGDRETARALLANAVDDSEVGHEARAHLAIDELAAGCLDRAGVHHAALRAVDLATAAARVVLGVVAGRPVDVDPALDRGILLATLVPWLETLLAGERDDAAIRFRENAPRYREVVPRIDELLVVRA